jgi:hypothetical protein
VGERLIEKAAMSYSRKANGGGRSILRRVVDFRAGGKIYSGGEAGFLCLTIFEINFYIANISNHHNYLYKRRRTTRLASFDPP